MDPLSLKLMKTTMLDNSHVNALTTASVGCGGVPDGFHGSIGAGSVNDGFSASVSGSYGSPNFSVVGNAGTTHTHSGNFNGSSDTASGTLYICPSGSSNTYSVGFNGTQTNTSSFGFTGSLNGGAFSFGSSW